MQAFANIRVLDLSHIIAGPFCTYQLAVMGADVIRVENSKLCDPLREDGGELQACIEQMGSTYQAQAANKRAIAVDLKSAKGKEILAKLIATADVLVENYRAGAMRDLGFAYEDVMRIKPEIIYCSISGFGQEGPLSNRTAYDNVIQAMSGLMATTGKPESGAVKVGPPVLDYGTGIQAAFAVATALYQRILTGEGQYIDISMLDSAVMLSGSNFTTLQSSGKAPPLSGNDSETLAGYGCFDTKEGKLMIGAYTAEQNYRLWKTLGDEAYGATLRKLPLYQMHNHKDADRARLTEIFMTKTADDWERLLNDDLIPASKVLDVEETFSHPQFDSRAVFQELKVGDSTIKFTAAAFSYTDNGPSIHSAPPKFGEHTAEVLYDLGYKQQQIDDLADQEVILLADVR